MFSSMRFLCIHFYPRPPRGGRPTISSASSAPRNFYPRPPRGGRPVCFAAGRVSVSISIHALREEGDSSPIFKKVAILNFYPRPPRGGRRGVCAGIVAPELISIHALREEGDAGQARKAKQIQDFYPRPPRGGRHRLFIEDSYACHFYPRPPRGGRRLPRRVRCIFRQNFYPRPPRGGRRVARLFPLCKGVFLSTPSARRATRFTDKVVSNLVISIHALREEGDPAFPSQPSAAGYFYPRPPRGGRPTSASSAGSNRTYFYPRPPRGGRRVYEGLEHIEDLFLSTPSARRATTKDYRTEWTCKISIHALREEGDESKTSSVSGPWIFLSTPSARRATHALTPFSGILEFLSTPSARRATFLQPIQLGINGNFYPRPPRGGRPFSKLLKVDFTEISIHALREEGDNRPWPYS